MSIMKIANISDIESDEYRSLVHKMYCQYWELYKLMCRYKIYQSAFYLKLAYKNFEKNVEQDLMDNQ